MFDHVVFGVSDYEASKAFFLKALKPIGIAVVSEGPLGIELSSDGKSSLCIRRIEEKPAHLHLAFTAESREQVEEFHRELKQLTGSEKCQCRKARSQRNHLACCYHAWLSLKVQAKAFNKTIYRVRTDLFSDYLRNELRNPTIKAFQTT